MSTEDQANQEPPIEGPKAEPGKKEEPEAKAMLIPIGASGKVEARDNAEMLRLCGALISAQAVPERFDTPIKLFGAIQFVRDLKLPDTAIRQVANIEGTMAAFGDLPLALAQRTNELCYFREQWFDKQYNVISFKNKNLDAEIWGAVCYIGREGVLDPETGKNAIEDFSFTLDDAKKAGLYPAKKRDGTPSPNSPWSKWTQLMLRYKARTIALKSVFADAIHGIAIAEYDFEQMPNVIDVTPKESKNATADALRAAAAQEEQNG